MEKNVMGFISYGKYVLSFFFKIYNFPSPFSDIMNILQINTTSETYPELNRRDWLLHLHHVSPVRLTVHPATFMTGCFWFTWAGISVIILHHPSVCGIRASGYIDGSNDPLHFTCITKGNWTTCPFLRFFISAQRFLSSEGVLSVSPVDGVLIWS